MNRLRFTMVGGEVVETPPINKATDQLLSMFDGGFDFTLSFNTEGVKKRVINPANILYVDILEE